MNFADISEGTSALRGSVSESGIPNDEDMNCVDICNKSRGGIFETTTAAYIKQKSLNFLDEWNSGKWLIR